jgi:hypothetical protein
VTNSTTASSYTFDYSTGGIFYITAPPSTNFTCNFTNVPADINRNYVITVIINSTTNKTFCNSVQINSNTAISPVFANGMPTSMNFGTLMTQSIAIQRVTAGDLTANVNVIASLTPYSSASTGNYLIASAADASLSYRLYVGSDASFGGNLFVTNTLKPTNISEPFTTNAGTTSPYTLSFSSGATFYISTPPASNFTINLTNVPADTGRTYVVTLIISAGTNKTFCNLVQINSNTGITPYYSNGVPSSITTGTYITQTISIVRISAGDTAATVLSAITSWY